MYKHILLPMALEYNCHIRNAMEIAHRLLAEGGKITALHVMERVSGQIATYLPKDYQQTRRSEALATLKAELDGIGDAHADVLTGHPGRAIHDYAEQHDCDCIIMTSHQPDIQDYFLGSTAAWVVRHSKCSVHVIRNAGIANK